MPWSIMTPMHGTARAMLLLPLLLVHCATTASAPLTARTVAPLAHREVLPNGIVLLVAERPAVPIVVVLASFAAGSAFDPPDSPGLANLTASVLTRGTVRRTGPEVDQAIEFVGGSLEAGAGRDSLTVLLSILKKDLTLGLDLLQEVVRTPTFPESEVGRKVREIVAAIQRSEESPETVAGRELMRLVYPHHPYGHPVIGTRESVGALTRPRVVQFFERHVRPDRMIIAVVGAVTMNDARREVHARFGNWARPSTPAPVVGVAPLPAGSAEAKTVARPHLTQATVYLGRQVIRQDDPDYYPLSVASYILGGGSASRLYHRVRDEGGLAYAVYSHVSPARYGSTLAVTLQTRTDEVGKAVALTRAELARLVREPVTEPELTLAKSYLIGSFPLRLDTSGKMAGFLVTVEEQGLGLDYAERYKERIARVTAADVQRVASRYLTPDSFSAVTVGNVP
jgi:zinc protease